MVFQGRVNLQGDHCIDTLSDRANAKRGAGHVAPDLAIDSNGKFHGSITETFPSGSDTTSITGHTSNGKLAGTIRGNEPPNNRFPSGCKIKTTFTARATWPGVTSCPVRRCVGREPAPCAPWRFSSASADAGSDGGTGGPAEADSEISSVRQAWQTLLIPRLFRGSITG